MAMAMAMARLSSSKVVPRAVRTILSPSILSGSNYAITNNKSRFASLQQSPFSKVADEQIESTADMKLAKVIDSKIQIAVSPDLEKPAGIEPPEDFPFEVEDLPDSSQIKLTRKFEGEFIEVIVEKDEDEGEPTIYSDTDEDVYEYPRRRLFSVRINPENQERWMLFKCWVDAKSLGITSIEFYESSATVDPILKLVRPDVGGLDADLEDYWKKKKDYLKIRGFSYNDFGSKMETCVGRSMSVPDFWSRLENLRKNVKLVEQRLKNVKKIVKLVEQRLS